MAEALLIQEIPMSRIRVLNPRSRGRTSHKEIVDSIEQLGLKRPITVSVRRDGDGESFDLVCGQGRLEAYQKLGQSCIPAVVLDLSEEECLVRSLVENVARRRHDGVELLGDVLNLRGRGYSDAEIAEKIGLSTSWVSKVALLLERGETDLIRAVETGYLPVSLAVVIASEPSGEVQQILAGAYRHGALKAGDVGRIRRLLDRRSRRGSESPRPASAREALDALQTQAEAHRMALKRADLLKTRLAFVVEALRDVRAQHDFTALLKQDGLDDLPRALADRFPGEPDA
jgi:ParB family chromosome partitioning protein